MKDKRKRQSLILDIIKKHKVKNQFELLDILKKEGFETTQATLSRDLKELGIVRVRDEKGEYIYKQMEKEEIKIEEKLKIVFENFVKEVKRVNNLILVKTTPGNAHGVASLIDHCEIKGLEGTVAGDDTILVVVNNLKNAKEIERRFKELVSI